MTAGSQDGKDNEFEPVKKKNKKTGIIGLNLGFFKISYKEEWFSELKAKKITSNKKIKKSKKSEDVI